MPFDFVCAFALLRSLDAGDLFTAVLARFDTAIVVGLPRRSSRALSSTIRKPYSTLFTHLTPVSVVGLIVRRLLYLCLPFSAAGWGVSTTGVELALPSGPVVVSIPPG